MKILKFALLLLLLPAITKAAGGTCPSSSTYLANTATFPTPSVSLAALGVTNCYFASSAGSDSNSGTTEASPWAHLPGMSTCTGNCAALSPSAGQGFILRGGDTWNGSNLGINWNWGGTATNPIYIGVDPAWYAGSAWARPIWTCGGATCTGAQTGYYWSSTKSNVILDNIEMAGFFVDTTTNSGAVVVNPCGTNQTYENIYIHGWSQSPVVTNTVGSGFEGCNGSNLTGDVLRYNVIDGTDTAQNMMTGMYLKIPVAYGNVLKYVITCIDATGDNWHDNICDHMVSQPGGGHQDGFYHVSQVYSANSLLYNNIVSNATFAGAGGAVKFWINGNAGCPFASCTSYMFNNVIYNNLGPNIFDQGGHLAINYGTWYIFNNTIDCGDDATPGSCGVGDGGNTGGTMTLTSINNHWITTGSSVTGCTHFTCSSTTDLLQTQAVANSQGYNDTGVYAWLPTSASGSTVNGGTNEQSLCSTIAAISGPAGVACQNGTGYAGVYNQTTHTVSFPALALKSRPTSAAWDIGAYEYTSSGPIIIIDPSANPLAFGSVNIGSNASLTDTLTNGGTATLTLNTPYYTITGTNAADFAVVAGGTCANGASVAVGQNCTVSVKFTPSLNGAEAATLNISGNAVANIALTGTGVAVSTILTINPGSNTGFYVQPCSSGFSGTASTVSCTFANPQSLNDTNYCSISWSATSGTITSITDSNGNSYGSNLLTTTGQGWTAQSFLSVPVVAGSNTITVAFPAGVSYPELKCAEYQGQLAIDVLAGNTGVGSAMSSGTAATTFATDVIVGTTYANNATPGSGFIQRYVINGDLYEDEPTTATGNYAATANQTPSGGWLIQMAALQAPQSLIFPTQTTSTTSAAQTITLTNTGSSSITLSTPYFTISGTNSADYAKAGGTCTNALVLTVGSSCTATVTFTPGAAGTRVATFNISGSPGGSVPLTGTGLVAPQAATPTFSPVAGVYTSTQTVTISTVTGSATICYTTDGTTPTANGAGTCTHGTTYSTTVSVSVSETLKAIASKSGDTDSAIGVAAYTINQSSSQLAAPTFSPVAGSYSTAQSVTISGPAGATLCYTLDGSTPTANGAGACTNGSFYSSTIPISVTTTIKAVASQSGPYYDSTVASALYTITSSGTPTVGTPIVALVGGKPPNTLQQYSVTSTTSGATICYTLNGIAPTTNGSGTCTYGGTLTNGGTLTFNQSTILEVIGSKSGSNDSGVGIAIILVFGGNAPPSPPYVLFM